MFKNIKEAMIYQNIRNRFFQLRGVPFEIEGKEHHARFKDNFIRSVHDVSIWSDKGREKSTITSAYPHLGRRICELALAIKIKIVMFIERLLLHNQ